MADISIAQTVEGSSVFNTWETLTSSNTAGQKWEPANRQGIGGSVQFTGTFDSATAVLQGSNDGSTWVTLNDTSGVAISMTAAGAADFSTAMRYIRPSTSGGGGSQDIDCIIVARG